MEISKIKLILEKKKKEITLMATFTLRAQAPE